CDVAADLDLVEVVLAEESATADVTAEDAGRHGGQGERRDLDRRDEGETPAAPRLACDRQRQPARVRVRAAVGHERGGRAAVAPALALRLPTGPAAPTTPPHSA